MIWHSYLVVGSWQDDLHFVC